MCLSVILILAKEDWGSAAPMGMERVTRAAL